MPGDLSPSPCGVLLHDESIRALPKVDVNGGSDHWKGCRSCKTGLPTVLNTILSESAFVGYRALELRTAKMFSLCGSRKDVEGVRAGLQRRTFLT